MKIHHSGLAIIECRSRDSRVGSLRSHLETVAETCWDEPAASSSEIVSSKATFASAFERWAVEDQCRYLCVAGHGQPGEVVLQSGPSLSARDLAELIRSHGPNAGFDGIHLSTCGTMTKEFAEMQLSASNELHWISGYTRDVDWLQSMALDMVFLGLLIDIAYERDYGRDVIAPVEATLIQLAGPLCDHLGFVIHRRC